MHPLGQCRGAQPERVEPGPGSDIVIGAVLEGLAWIIAREDSASFAKLPAEAESVTRLTFPSHPADPSLHAGG